jgi:AcrR family transcriptional regulator
MSYLGVTRGNELRMPPRGYELGRRRAGSEATRERILEAARALVGGKGDLASFSMESVARRAGVSRMTVYNRFASRTGLLDALADYLAEKGGMHRLREVFAQDDLEAAVRRFVDVFVGFWESDRTTLRRMRALGVLFPSLHGGLPGRDAWRLEAANRLVAKFGRGTGDGVGPLRPDAAELLSVITGFDTFDALRTASRSSDEVARLLTEAALTLLLTRSPRAEARGSSPRRRATHGP